MDIAANERLQAIIIVKGVDPMPSEKLEKLKHDQYVAERKLTAAKHKEKRLESEIKRQIGRAHV